MTYRDDCYAYGRIPLEPFKEIVQSFIDKVDMGEVIGRSWGSEARAKGQEYSALEAVAGWAGTNSDHLQKILKGRFQSVTFDLADKVLCATVGPDAWHSDPELNEQYNRVSLAAA